MSRPQSLHGKLILVSRLYATRWEESAYTGGSGMELILMALISCGDNDCSAKAKTYFSDANSPRGAFAAPEGGILNRTDVI